ncbi:MAG: inositol monophosphatase [Tannerella sp.]|jgi:myo-inositol-1(or 4)-monophosphatase|nr:inositol monophosphatase [Tannerella sp.]
MIQPPYLEQLTEKIIRIAEEAGDFLHEQRKSFRPEDVIEKEKYDYVSHIDKDTEIMLIERLSKLLPEAGFISEEGQAEYHDEEYCWIVDPLDGTTNYIHDLAPYCVSIALRKGHDLLIGVVYEVCRRECFYAWKGGGAYLNDKRIQVSQTSDIDKSLIGTGLPYNYTKYRPLADVIIPHFYGSSMGIRISGSAAANLCYVAAGRYDCWFEAHIKLWDFAAGALIVTEAGGITSGMDNNPDVTVSHHIIASSGRTLHDKVLKALSGYIPDIL